MPAPSPIVYTNAPLPMAAVMQGSFPPLYTMPNYNYGTAVPVLPTTGSLPPLQLMNLPQQYAPVVLTAGPQSLPPLIRLL